MIVAICRITLIFNRARSIAVHLRKDNRNPDPTWNVIPSSRQGLKLPADDGIWIPPYDWSNNLVLTTKDRNHSPVLFVYNIKKDFWLELTGYKSFVNDAADLFNGNPLEMDVSCKFY